MSDRVDLKTDPRAVDCSEGQEQCPYAWNSSPGEDEWLACGLVAGHDGEHRDAYGYARDGWCLYSVGLAWSREVEAWFAQCERAVSDLTKDGNTDVAHGICEAVRMFCEQHGEAAPEWTNV